MLPEVLKRRNIVSNDEVERSCELRIRFDQHIDGGVTWYVQPEQIVSDTFERSHADLAESGVPISILGIRLLTEFIDENVMNLVLGRASGYLWRAHAQRLEREANFASDDYEGSVVSEPGKELAVH
jgi:hypothetical protein